MSSSYRHRNNNCPQTFGPAMLRLEQHSSQLTPISYDMHNLKMCVIRVTYPPAHMNYSLEILSVIESCVHLSRKDFNIGQVPIVTLTLEGRRVLQKIILLQSYKNQHERATKLCLN